MSYLLFFVAVKKNGKTDVKHQTAFSTETSMVQLGCIQEATLGFGPRTEAS